MKIKNMKLMLLGLLAMGSVNASAAVGDVIVKDAFKYTILTQSTVEPNVGTVSLTSVDEPFADGAVVTIPETITKNVDGKNFTFTVTEISQDAFNNSLLGEVTIAKTITNIGARAFMGATHLKKITFPSGSQLTYVANAALSTTQISEFDFSNCTKLTTIHDNAFVRAAEAQNTFIKKVVLPTSTTFTSIGTALAKLPNLESLNIKDSKITSIVANAFAGDKKLTKMELPGTVVTIADGAFSQSYVSELTINVDAISTIGAGTGAVYGAGTTPVKDVETLTSLTLKGNLKGQIKTKAFQGMAKLATLDMSGMNFITTGQIETLAFDNCPLLTSVKIGNIANNNAGKYTIATLAFQDCVTLATVEIGNIESAAAVVTSAFGAVTGTNKPALTSVKIGNIYSEGTVPAIAATAFTFADAKSTLVIANVRSKDVKNPVIAAGAFVYTATDAKNKAASITIGAVEGKGKNFTAGITAQQTGKPVITSLTFTGDIEEKGIDVANLLDDNTALKTLTFNGKIASNGISGTAFQNMPNGATINFNGLLGNAAAVAGAFKPAAQTDALTVNYNYDGSDLDVNVTPFVQSTFWNALVPFATPRTVTLKVANAELAARIRGYQSDLAATWTTTPSATADIFWNVKLIAVPQSLLVYQKDSGNTSYGRFQFTAASFPNGLQISRHQDGVTYTLYTTYVEDDADSKIVTINMQPVPSLDGKYYIDPADLPMVFIVKATGTTGETTEMKYTDFPVGGTGSDYYFPTTINAHTTVQVATAQVTNEYLCAGTAAAPFNDLNNDNKTYATPQDIYFISNPAQHKGIKAQTWDFNKIHDVYVAAGSFYVIASRYAGASAARIVWLDGSEEATAIKEVKKVVEDGVIYNLAGQQVDANYKGIVIKNGKKMIQK